jgi:peptidoglycan-associated lipoprotein
MSVAHALSFVQLKENPNMTRFRAPLLSVLAAAALLVGCSSTPLSTDVAPVESRPTGAAQSGAASTPGGASASGTPQSGVATVDLAASRAASAAAAAANAPRVVYFDFDSFVIKDEFKPAVDVHAKALAADKTRRMTIEGHTDERGGREYNLALGQKRAEAVLRSLALLGASEQQLEAVSFGEERPADPGHDEAAWAKNRRAELKDRR